MEPQRISNFVHFSLKIWHLVASGLLNFLTIKWPQCIHAFFIPSCFRYNLFSPKSLSIILAAFAVIHCDKCRVSMLSNVGLFSHLAWLLSLHYPIKHRNAKITPFLCCKWFAIIQPLSALFFQYCWLATNSLFTYLLHGCINLAM